LSTVTSLSARLAKPNAVVELVTSNGVPSSAIVSRIAGALVAARVCEAVVELRHEVHVFGEADADQQQRDEARQHRHREVERAHQSHGPDDAHEPRGHEDQDGDRRAQHEDDDERDDERAERPDDLLVFDQRVGEQRLPVRLADLVHVEPAASVLGLYEAVDLVGEALVELRVVRVARAVEHDRRGARVGRHDVAHEHRISERALADRVERARIFGMVPGTSGRVLIESSSPRMSSTVVRLSTRVTSEILRTSLLRRSTVSSTFGVNTSSALTTMIVISSLPKRCIAPS
jgi:hypothetical protein